MWFERLTHDCGRSVAVRHPNLSCACENIWRQRAEREENFVRTLYQRRAASVGANAIAALLRSTMHTKAGVGFCDIPD